MSTSVKHVTFVGFILEATIKSVSSNKYVIVKDLRIHGLYVVICCFPHL